MEDKTFKIKRYNLVQDLDNGRIYILSKAPAIIVEIIKKDDNSQIKAPHYLYKTKDQEYYLILVHNFNKNEITEAHYKRLFFWFKAQIDSDKINIGEY